MASHIRRRKFLATLGCAAATWPLAARAQSAGRMRRIGVLMTTSADDPEGQSRIAAFHQGLQQWGWTVGGNVTVDIRFGVDNSVIRKHDRHGAGYLQQRPYSCAAIREDDIGC